MPLIFSKADLSDFAQSDDEVVGLLDATEKSLQAIHTGDPGNTFFSDIQLSNQNQAMVTGSAVGDEYPILRVFPGGGNSGSRDNGAFILILDPATGGLLAMLAGDDVNTLRTAVPAGLGARHLASKNASVLTILGSSEQARGHGLTITRAVPQLKEIVVWSPTPASREAFAEEQAEVLGLPVTAVDTAAEAVSAGDVVTAAGRTKPHTPAYEDEWVKPGALAISMNHSSPQGLRDRSRIVVPTLNRAERNAFGFGGRVKIDPLPDPEGIIQLGDILAGSEVARTDEQQTIVFELANTYLWDQPIMTQVFNWATQRGLGTQATLTGP